MAGPRIPRDFGHPFNASDPAEQVTFLQHGVAIPDSVDLVDRAGVLNPLLNPDPAVADAVDRRRTLLTPDTVAGITVTPLTNPDTIVLPTPDNIPFDVSTHVSFQRHMNHGNFLPVPYPTKTGLNAIEVWGFEDPLRPGTEPLVWPAKTIRVREGQIVHSFLATRRGTHTIHHHGIEPTPMNDGVGHVTFEVAGAGYTYQWLAAEAGTYFYHCHKNTPLHFEMGMYGMLIIDPPAPGAPFADGGPGAVRRRDNIVNYDIEKVWALDDFDSRWHDVVSADVGAGVGNVNAPFTAFNAPNNPRINEFDADYFLISGVIADRSGNFNPLDPNIGRVATTAQQGQMVLMRILNGAYYRAVIRFPAALNPEVIAMDGRTLGKEGTCQYSSPFRLSTMNNQFELTTARRWDLLIDTASVPPGSYTIEVEYRHWITGELARTVRAPFVVNS